MNKAQAEFLLSLLQTKGITFDLATCRAAADCEDMLKAEIERFTEIDARKIKT